MRRRRMDVNVAERKLCHVDKARCRLDLREGLEMSGKIYLMALEKISVIVDARLMHPCSARAVAHQNC